MLKLFRFIFQLHVEGQFCDKCIPGYFGLSAANPEGCMKCYCSGVAQSCNSSVIEISMVMLKN